MNRVYFILFALFLADSQALAQHQKSTSAKPIATGGLLPKQSSGQSALARVLGVAKLSHAERKTLVNQLHTNVNKGNLSSADEGALIFSIAVLHSFDKNPRFAALPMIVYAKGKWTAMVEYKELPRLWELLVEGFGGRTSVEEVTLSSIADHLDGAVMRAALPASFAFYRGIALMNQNKFKESLDMLRKVPLSSADYRRAKFLEANGYLQSGSLNEAQSAFQIVISLDRTGSELDAGISNDTVVRLRELGVLNMARLLYERGMFNESLAYYRTLNQDSHFFYDSLSEQAWAFFMSGYPNRAGGAVYAALSPFFLDRFLPDGYFLNGVIDFWLCDYESSRQQLLKFIQYTKNEGDQVRNFVRYANSLPLSDSLIKYSKFFEDLMVGASPKNLGIGPRTAGSIKSKEHVVDLYARLKGLVDRRLNMQSGSELNSFGPGKERLLRALLAYENTVRQFLGIMVRAELTSLAVDFEKSLTQSRILYMEILTAKKDLLLGKNRSVSAGEFVGEESAFMEIQSGSDPKIWSQDKQEYWYDELGSYVFQKKSLCTAR